MSDLIDRAKLLKVFEERKKPNNGGEDGTKERYRYMQWLTDYNAVIEAPSAEPKKGKWIYNSPVTMKCNQCELVIKDWDWHRFNYCPNCGARMEGDTNG